MPKGELENAYREWLALRQKLLKETVAWKQFMLKLRKKKLLYRDLIGWEDRLNIKLHEEMGLPINDGCPRTRCAASKGGSARSG